MLPGGLIDELIGTCSIDGIYNWTLKSWCQPTFWCWCFSTCILFSPVLDHIVSITVIIPCISLMPALNYSNCVQHDCPSYNSFHFRSPFDNHHCRDRFPGRDMVDQVPRSGYWPGKNYHTIRILISPTNTVCAASSGVLQPGQRTILWTRVDRYLVYLQFWGQLWRGLLSVPRKP